MSKKWEVKVAKNDGCVWRSHVMGETPEDAMEAAMSHCRSDVNATDCSIWDADTGECWTRYRDEIGYREWRWLPMEREGIYDLADWDPAEAVRLAYGD